MIDDDDYDYDEGSFIKELPVAMVDFDIVISRSAVLSKGGGEFVRFNGFPCPIKINYHFWIGQSIQTPASYSTVHEATVGIRISLSLSSSYQVDSIIQSMNQSITMIDE